MQLPSPLPHTLREAVWQVTVAILLATRAKDIWAFCQRVWRVLRESSATAQIKAAQAHKTDAEAEEIQTRTAISAAAWMRDISVTVAELTATAEQLKGKVASQASIIALQEAELKDWRMRHPEDVRNEKGGPNPAA